ncbi:hypothetical protein PFDSM3638_02685 [Pyrococcus furiosus DSM 3638]|uniref:Protein argonaute n=3 Tax=Pyrococcus furiosus TaxID=2261 RepID=AGO_PYRFU|nr:Piwi domain-containing protein [Pyrococcus furiosus]Q8U3D2.1 RecName: Full=Protein argonaute; Short=PfAgo [Pyrococcus furiosus DSM 3638]AAL80661.1 hypothetical protein PF0537 [Pyrococcus furiosus DSM 3638]AFN03332.1 hypothetical protein PFC_01805 [Pyrococcus furiosus COM1]QEK78248.1 hypothetical protein PFDSM3638_02685 [Pyrococcus furiosus DSM 3638]
MKAKVVINLVKINKKIIPDKIYVYRLFNDPEEELQKEGYSIYRLAYENVGIVIDPENLIIATTKELEYEGEFIPEGEISFSELRNDYQSKLVLRLLKENGIGEYELSKLLRKFRKPKTFGDYKVIPSVEMSVIKHDEDFYLVIHIIHQIQSMKTLWELVNKDPKELEEFLMTHKENLMLKDIASPLKTVYKPCFEEYTKKPKLDHNQEIVKYWYNYHIERYWNTPEAKLEFYRKFGQVDLKQPAILAKFASKIKKNKNYKIYLLPQLVVPTYNAEQLESDVAKEILEYTKLMPEERKELLENILAEVDSDIIDKSLSEIEVEKIAQELENKIRVRDDKGNSVPISQLNVQKSQLLLWTNYSRKYPVILPYEVPEKFRKIREIPMFIILDSGLLADIQNFATNEFRELVKSMYYSLAKKYNSLAKKARSTNEIGLPFLDFRGKEKVITEDLNSDKGIIEVVEQVSSFMKGKELGLAFIAARNKLSSEKFEEIKRRLFNLNVISQVVNEDTLKNKRDKYDRNRLDLFVRHNLLFQVLSKLGVKYYVLDYRFNYDYIIGIDVAPMKRSEGYIGGSAVMFDSQGYIRKIVPIKIGEQRGESVDMNEFFKEMVDKFKEFNIKLDNKKILLLRDGRITNNEEEGLKYISEMFDIEVVTMDVIKNHPVRAFANMKMYFNLGGAIYLIPHKLKQAKGTPIPIKLAKKRIIKNGKVEKQSITRQDVLDIFILTRLNYGSISADMRLPAPVHYAHKFANAIRNEWKIKEEFLAEGFLYFV